MADDDSSSAGSPGNPQDGASSPGDGAAGSSDDTGDSSSGGPDTEPAPEGSGQGPDSQPDDSQATTADSDGGSASGDPSDSEISITSADESGASSPSSSDGDASSQDNSTDSDASENDTESSANDQANSDDLSNSLAAAAQDADNNAGGESPDSGVTQCGANTTPGNLKVTVLDSETGKPIAGATVAISGPANSSDIADGSGVVQKNGLTPGSYNATASSNGYTTGTGTATVASSATASITINLTPITVVIALGQPVACPGHPLSITATGTPAGGTFAWTIAAPTADLVDGSNASVRNGANVNLLGFQSDPATGNIPAQMAAIGVTYTYTNGQTATANQNVTIHEIKFVLTNNAINQKPVTVTEAAGFVNITFPAAGGATMSTDPQVEIQLAATCPRKAACAHNHRVGWIQTVLTSVTRLRYTHTLISSTPPLPARDAISGATAPFYDTTATFTGDHDKQTAHHEDTPGIKAPWTDPRPGSPAPPPAINKQLRQVERSMSFTAWLVVQNIEWAAHDIPGSLAFVGHFDWSMGINLAVDTAQAVGSRATPPSQAPVVPATISAGEGGGAPTLDGQTFNDLANAHANLHIDLAPGI